MRDNTSMLVVGGDLVREATGTAKSTQMLWQLGGKVPEKIGETLCGPKTGSISENLSKDG